MNMTPRQKRDQVIGWIAAAIETGDIDRAQAIRVAYADLLKIEFPKLPDPSRQAASPINTPFANLEL